MTTSTSPAPQLPVTGPGDIGYLVPGGVAAFLIGVAAVVATIKRYQGRHTA